MVNCVATFLAAQFHHRIAQLRPIASLAFPRLHEFDGIERGQFRRRLGLVNSRPFAFVDK